MDSRIRCANCRRLFVASPRVKEQRYCSKKSCQRARKSLWQKRKMSADPDYRANQRSCQKQWQEKNPDYYRNYRSHHPLRAERNRLLQRRRNARRLIAKMDAIEPESALKAGTYYLLPAGDELIAKMDASTPKVFLIPMT